MAIEIDSCRCMIGLLHRQATEEIKLPINSARGRVKGTCACNTYRKRKKHQCDRYGSDEDCRRQNYRCKKMRPEAPFNSTQFLMAEHDNLSDSDISVGFRKRMQSFPYVKSYDLAEVEDDFLKKEFWSEYKHEDAERLEHLTKLQLVHECISLEERIPLMERELDIVQKQDRVKIREPSPAGEDEETKPGEVPVDAETATKIEIFTREIKNLKRENKFVRAGNISLRRSITCMSCGLPSDSRSMSSSDSSDDFTDQSNSSVVIPGRCNLKYDNLESNTDSGVASLEGNTSSSSEELKEESRYYLGGKPTKDFVSSTTL